MNKYVLGGLTAAGLLLGGLTSANYASATADSHVLVVNGTPYNSYKHEGGAIQWVTPPVDKDADVSFFEMSADVSRDQVWTGQGFEVCEFGTHWISNENNLVQSGCVAGPPATTSTTLLPPPPPGVPGVLVVPPPPTEETPSGTVAAAGPVPTTVPATAPVASVSPAAVPPAGVAPAGVAPTQQLPSTGSSSWLTALVAMAALMGGLGLVTLSRRSS